MGLLGIHDRLECGSPQEVLLHRFRLCQPLLNAHEDQRSLDVAVTDEVFDPFPINLCRPLHESLLPTPLDVSNGFGFVEVDFFLRYVVDHSRFRSI